MRVVIRRYADAGGGLHYYRLDQVDDPAYEHLIPCCTEDYFFPSRHPREMLGAANTAVAGQVRGGCQAWGRITPHVVVVRARSLNRGLSTPGEHGEGGTGRRWR